MNELKITIEGEAATGKSAFAFALRKLCIENNIPVVFSDVEIDDESIEHLEITYKKRLASLKYTTVVIETKRYRNLKTGLFTLFAPNIACSGQVAGAGNADGESTSSATCH